MAGTPVRRPLPALIALLALLLLTALVWWRVLHRDTGGGATAAATCPTTPPPAASLPAPSTITVQVLNATKRNGIAGKARTTLINDGFQSPAPAANDKPGVHIPGVAQIRYGSPSHDAAELLRYYFPGATLVPITSRTTTVTVSLGDKYKGVASAAAVSAALQRNRIVLTTLAPGQPSPSPSC